MEGPVRWRWFKSPFRLWLHWTLVALVAGDGSGGIPWSSVRKASHNGWQPEPLKFLAELHSNPFIFPFEQCFPRDTPATFIRCCSAYGRRYFPNGDCWQRPFLRGAQAVYLQELHNLSLHAGAGDGRDQRDLTEDALKEARLILQEVKASCFDNMCRQRHAPYDSLSFLAQRGVAYTESHHYFLAEQPADAHAGVEHPRPEEYKEWRGWQRQNLTNPLDCCGFQPDDLQAEVGQEMSLDPISFSEEYYEQKWPPALTTENRINKDLLTCQTVLAEIAIHELVALYIHSGSPSSLLFKRKALPPKAQQRYLEWSRRCAEHYAQVDRSEFWAQSLLDFPANRSSAEPMNSEDAMFIDILPPLSTVFNRTRAQEKRFGILVGCTHDTQSFCRLPVGLWQCYAGKHRHNTEIWYREYFLDFDTVLRTSMCSESVETGFVRQHVIGNLSEGDLDLPSGWRRVFNSLPYSSLCLLFQEALADKWRVKRMVTDVFGRYEWHLVVDGSDTSIGPGCFDVNLDQVTGAAPEAEVIVKDPSDFEDSNSGVFLVRRTPLGKLFLDLMMDKMNWPMELLGNGCYPDQSSMNEAILEIVAWELGAEYHSECLPHVFIEPVADAFVCNYVAHLECFKKHLLRMAGPFGSRRSKRIFFLPPHTAADMNFRPFGNVPDSTWVFPGSLQEKNEKVTFEWQPLIWHWVNYLNKREVMLQHLNLKSSETRELPPYPPPKDFEDAGAWNRFAQEEAWWCKRYMPNINHGRCTAVSLPVQSAQPHLKDAWGISYF